MMIAFDSANSTAARCVSYASDDPAGGSSGALTLVGDVVDRIVDVMAGALSAQVGRVER